MMMMMLMGGVRFELDLKLEQCDWRDRRAQGKSKEESTYSCSVEDSEGWILGLMMRLVIDEFNW